MAPLMPVVTPPDNRVDRRRSVRAAGINLAEARPLLSVSTSAGSMRPSVVVKVTCVPLCGGVPAASTTCALMTVESFADNALADAESVIVDPTGAISGTFSQAETAQIASAARHTRAKPSARLRASMRTVSILLP
jgi:hypothetical protein